MFSVVVVGQFGSLSVQLEMCYEIGDVLRDVFRDVLRDVFLVSPSGDVLRNNNLYNTEHTQLS